VCTVRPESFFDKSNKNETETNKTITGRYTRTHKKTRTYKYNIIYLIWLVGKGESEILNYTSVYVIYRRELQRLHRT